MKNLLSKSEENYDAFHILKNAGKYSSCIHCAYYSAFQLSIYSLCKFFRYRYKDIVGIQGADSHTFVIDKLGSCIEERNYFDSVDYLESINELKMIRKKADYWRDTITEGEVEDIDRRLDENVELIKKNYI